MTIFRSIKTVGNYFGNILLYGYLGSRLTDYNPFCPVLIYVLPTYILRFINRWEQIMLLIKYMSRMFVEKKIQANATHETESGKNTNCRTL